jgi:hypothetical protein
VNFESVDVILNSTLMKGRRIQVNARVSGKREFNE